MKNAPTTNSDESAQTKRNFTIVGTLPKRQDTVIAGVLAFLLMYRTLTGMHAVFSLSTTRLAAVIHALETRWGWNISRHDVVVHTDDGRTTSVTAYWLPATAINQVLAMGAYTWIEGVRTARVKRKVEGNLKKQADARANAIRARLAKINPRQQSLWED